MRDGGCDLALAPLTSYPEDIRQRTVRREVVRVAVGERHRLADREQIELASLRDETLELWPHEMAPGYYDAIIAACHMAGFEPKVDQHGAGSTVWGYIAEGRGVGLVVSSLIEQLPRGVKLLDLAPPRPMLTVNAVWRQDHGLPVDRAFLRDRETTRGGTPLGVAPRVGQQSAPDPLGGGRTFIPLVSSRPAPPPCHGGWGEAPAFACNRKNLYRTRARYACRHPPRFPGCEMKWPAPTP